MADSVLEVNERSSKDSINNDFKSKDKKEPSYETLGGESSDEIDTESRLNKLAKKSKKIIAASCTSPSNILRLKDKGEKLKKFTNKQKDSDKTKNTKQPNGLIEDELPIFGVPLETSIERNKCHDDILLPYPVRISIDFVEEFGLGFESVYKVNEVKSKVNQLKKLFNQRQPIQLCDYDVPVFTSLLKLFIRELPENLLTSKMLTKFEKIVAKKSSQTKDDKTDKCLEVSKLINQLPLCNQTLIAWILRHLNNVLAHEKQNKMNRQQISTIFSVLFKISNRLFMFLLSHGNYFFPVITLFKYIAPISLSELHNELSEDKHEIMFELAKQESLLSEIHREMNSGFLVRQELLWEVQTIITQLKRKLKMIEKQSHVKFETEEFEETVESIESSKLSEDKIDQEEREWHVLSYDTPEENQLNFNLNDTLSDEHINDLNNEYVTKSIPSSLSVSVTLSMSLTSSLTSISSCSLSLQSMKSSKTSLLSNVDGTSDNLDDNEKIESVADHDHPEDEDEDKDNYNQLAKIIFSLKYQTLAFEKIANLLQNQIESENESLSELIEKIKQVENGGNCDVIENLENNVSMILSDDDGDDCVIDDAENGADITDNLNLEMLLDMYRENMLLKEKKRYFVDKIVDEKCFCIKLQSLLAFFNKEHLE